MRARAFPASFPAVWEPRRTSWWVRETGSRCVRRRTAPVGIIPGRRRADVLPGADLDDRMRGIAWDESDAFLDEHPDAYKDIDVVMADAADLVEIRHTLRQFVNVKGD